MNLRTQIYSNIKEQTKILFGKKEMKTVKKLITLVLAFMLVLSLGVGALAEATNPGSITIKSALKDKTYDVFKIFDLTYTGSGTTAKVKYTIASDWENFFKTGGDGASYITDTDSSGKLNRIIVGGDTKFINITETNIADFTKAAQAYACKSATVTASKKATANGDLKIENLALGYYLVYPQGASETTGTNATICSLDSTIPSASVSIKSTYPTIKKTASEDDVQIGDTVTFTLESKVPDTNGYDSSKYTWKVTDTMTSGLSMADTSTVKVQIVSGSTTSDITSSSTISLSGQVLTVSVDMTAQQASVGATVKITYDAKVTSAAVVTETTNEAKITYSNNPKATTTEDTTIVAGENKIEVWSNKITLNNYDGKDSTKNTKVGGGEFVLMNSEGKYYKETTSSGTVTKIEWVDDEKDATVKTADANGAAAFIGLKDGTYSVKQTKWPDGYNEIDPNPITSISVAGTKPEGKEYKVGENEIVDIANFAGIALPSTGGMGTTIFYVIGSILVLGAIVLYVTMKRVNRDE